MKGFVVKYTLGNKIYDGIKRDILLGTYAPNTMLSERQIAEEYCVSKAPVRTALKKLCEDGYLIGYARKGYLVTNTSADDYAKLQQLRYSIEALAVSHIIMYCPDEDINDLRTISELIVPSTEKYATVNAQFHMAMASLTNNRYLIKYLDEIIFELDKAYAYINTDKEPLAEQTCHAQLIDAMLKRDRKSALDWLKADLELSDKHTLKPRYDIFSSVD